MISILRSSERGHVEHGWLDTRHTFSFAQYFNEDRMGFHSLRVINEDVIAPGQGFGKHFHDDMEIITYVLDGALEHKDNAGGGGVMRYGDVQKMSAGRGIIHSEFNHSKTEPVHLLQIWIIPSEFAIAPSYEQKAFGRDAKRGKLCLLASAEGRDGSIRLSQDADVYASILEKGEAFSFSPAAGRHVWVQVARGAVRLNGEKLAAGDAASIDDEPDLRFEAEEEAEFLLFDLS